MGRVRLWELFSIFFRIGMFSFGGGLSAWIYREIVELRGWLTEQEFLSGMALSQILPGANVSNLSVYIGQRLRGVSGAVVALLALLTAPFLAVIGLLAVYDRISAIPWAAAAMDGVAAAAIGLLLRMAIRAGRQASTTLSGAVALAATFIGVGVLRWPLIPVVLCVAPLSVAAAWPRAPENA